ncbi:Class II aaRS and biotin synthetases superfamily protein [Raphanus sativus]|uniref:Proline--tRNA ligase n=1 Tax=Raphanus sativus TaxID=3726 RepID=A0A6J0N6S6_RAPSA|nr:proline--tRNA ligase, cytoplasmic-like [Raphanus sativus]KAJ4902402.1 Class II aaRS and biotin synthetases superfamily protein [Raphanus sativus]
MSKSEEEDIATSTSSQSLQVPGKETEASVFAKRKEKEMKKETRLGISAKKEEDFASWYSQACRFGELITLSDTKGLYILEPTATKIWNILRSYMDAELEKLGNVEEKKFPMLIKRDSLEKEKDHIEGFKPEVAWVTRAGEHDLPTPYALRPTSETIIYPYFRNRIRTHRDLPMKVNQWVNVVRWEVSDPIPLIRGREFDWQEGHSAFATKEEADEEVLEVLNVYSRVYEDLLAVPVIKGRKSEKEKFAGADYTTSVEAFVPATGRGVQAATSHCLGQNFAKMFEITFEDKEVRKDKKKSMVWQNSWGLSTRSIGVMVMTHGDDKGLVLPPKVARYQVVVIPVPFKGADTKRISRECQAVRASLQGAGVRAVVDERENYACGWKYADWEMKGVPLRIELGPRDLEKNQVRVARRDTGAKMDVLRVDLVERVKDLLEEIQRDLYAVAKRRLEESIQKVETWDEFKEALRGKKLVLAPWCDEVEVENGVKENTKGENEAGAKTLCTPFEQPELREDTLCFASGKPAKKWTYWGRSY